MAVAVVIDRAVVVRGRGSGINKWLKKWKYCEC